MKRQDRYSKQIEIIPPSGIRRFFDLCVGNDDIISLGVGEPDFATPWNIREKVFYHLEKGRTSYTSNWGLVELRQAIAKYLNEKFKINYSPKDEILITIGVSEALDITLRSILNPGDEVIIPEPCFVAYKPLVTMIGAKAVALDTSKTGFAPKAEDIEKLITEKTKAILICYPNNPTGVTIKLPQLKKIAELAKQNDLWVISDEVYAELTYEGAHISIAALPGLKENTITLSGFSKSFAMTGWRIGYIACPAELMARIVKLHQYCAMCAPIMAQYGALEALENSKNDLDIMRESYKQRRNLMLKGVNDMGLSAPYPDGAFYIFIDIRKTKMTSEKFALGLLNQKKVAVVPGDVFGTGGEGFIRCSYATDIASLKEALKRIKEFIR